MKLNQHRVLSAAGLARMAWLLVAGAFLAHRVQAAEFTHYGVAKTRNYLQSGPVPATPLVTDTFSFYAFVYQAQPEAILAGILTGPAGAPGFLFPSDEDEKLLESLEEFASQGELDAARPSGVGLYSFQLFSGTGGEINAKATLAADAYPVAPALDNFVAAQDIDRTKPLVLQWTKPPQLDATDYIHISVFADDALIFSTPRPWQPNALAGNTTSFSLPANLLPASGVLTGEIQFINVTARDTQTIAGATGLAGYAAATGFPLKLRTGGGGADVTPPRLSNVVPMLGAMGVATTSPVVFSFNEAMKAQQQITWLGPPNPAGFVYAWSADGKTLTCNYPGGFPASTPISWQLVPAGFADLAGNALAGDNLAGLFITGSGGITPPCESGFKDRANSFLAGRLANFTQVSPAAPVPATDLMGDNPPAAFLASFSPTGLTVSAAEVVIPGGQRKTLTSLFGHYFLSQTFATEAALISAYPNGSYTSELTLSGVKSSQSVTLGNGPNTPHVSNFDAAQAVNPAAAFTLSWDALVGVTANDRIEITIYSADGQNVLLRLPDECAMPPKPLAPTATSISIPANLLQLATTYPAELTFFRVSDIKNNASPAYSTVGAFVKTTRFPIRTIGGGMPNVTPVITAYRISNDGKFEADVTGSVGRTIKLEASDLSAGWSTVGMGVVPPGGKVTVRDSRAATLMSQVYRARSE